VLSRFIFWPCLAGLIILVIGLFTARKEFARAVGIDKLTALSRVFYAAPLALFGAEHLVAARGISQIVPPWMPGRLFWAYFVGTALIAAALSLVLAIQLRLSSTLLGVMFTLFVLLIHLPNVVANPKDRILWAVALRDLSFSGGAWALAGSQGSKTLITIGRFSIAIPALFFAIEHFLHPEFVPGVPLAKLIPSWVPFPPAIGYLTGAFLLVAGVLMLINKWVRTGATWLGLEITLCVLFLYVPILAMASGGAALTEGQNYVADTLLFAGTVLLLASAMPPAAWPNNQPARL